MRNVFVVDRIIPGVFAIFYEDVSDSRVTVSGVGGVITRSHVWIFGPDVGFNRARDDL